MSDIGEGIKHLYSKFILRDVLSFVTPGAIVVGTALLLKWEPARILEWMRQVRGIMYIPIFGLFYAVGFALQCFGEILRCIPLLKLAGIMIHDRKGKSYREFKKQLKKDLKVISDLCVYGQKTSKKLKKHFKKFCRIVRKVRDEISDGDQENIEQIVKFSLDGVDEGAKQERERIVVLKQMCGNMFMAGLISGILLDVRGIMIVLRNSWSWERLPWALIGSITAGVLLFALYWGNHKHAERQRDFEDIYWNTGYLGY